MRPKILGDHAMALRPAPHDYRDRTPLDQRRRRRARGTPHDLVPHASQLRRDQHVLSYQQLTGPFWRNPSTPVRRAGRVLRRHAWFGQGLGSRGWRLAVAGLIALAIAITIFCTLGWMIEHFVIVAGSVDSAERISSFASRSRSLPSPPRRSDANTIV